jgi:hypothetical protein
MGKHEAGYARVARDLYPTRERWIVEALLAHVQLAGVTAWEPATGHGDLVTALRDSGARVVASDIADYGFPLDALLDFTTGQVPPAPFEAIVTNPPGGPRNTTAEAFITTGLKHLTRGASLLALLLPVDFDSAGKRRAFFAECPAFAAKIVLTRRIVWFERSDGVRAAPKENHAWFVWQWTAFKTRTPPLVLYAPVPPAERFVS